MPTRPPSLGRRALSALGWYLLPAFVVGIAAAYIGLAFARQVNPPVVPVTGTSMLPALRAGDLVVLDRADPDLLEVGDVIAFDVSRENQEQYGLPPRYVHRIIEIEQGEGVRQFRTQGDNVDGVDPIWVLERDLVGVMDARVPFVGWPMLFAQSSQGKLFGLAVLAVVGLYFALGLWDERRAAKQGEVVTVNVLAAETRELRDRIKHLTGAGSPLPAPEGSATLSRLADGVEQTVTGQARTEEAMERLLVAIGEYGEHLRSHTAVMQGIGGSATHLLYVTERLADAMRAAGITPAGVVPDPPAVPPEPTLAPPTVEIAEAEPADVLPEPVDLVEPQAVEHEPVEVAEAEPVDVLPEPVDLVEPQAVEHEPVEVAEAEPVEVTDAERAEPIDVTGPVQVTEAGAATPQAARSLLDSLRELPEATRLAAVLDAERLVAEARAEAAALLRQLHDASPDQR